MVEFASANNRWVSKNLENCETEEAIPISLVTTCTMDVESLKQKPLFLADDDLVRARVWAINKATGLKAPSDGWDCKPEDGTGSLVFLD